MISIIVATSKSRKDLVAFELNIQNSIGVKHEIIFEQNNGEIGLCEIYNYAAKKSNFDILCFVHDDVEFLTNKWGDSISKTLKDVKDVGILGIAGSTYLTKTISSWWQPKILDYEPKRVNIIQKYKHQLRGEELVYYNPNDEKLSAVCTLDGVFLVCRKEIWKSSPFDEKLLDGFHGYDMAFCLGMKEKLKNYVIFDILIRHESEGLNDINWYNAIKLVKKKYMNNLPMISDVKIDAKFIADAENFWISQNETFSITKTRKNFFILVYQRLFIQLQTLKDILGFE